MTDNTTELPHPIDPLTAAEIEAARDVVRDAKSPSDRTHFMRLELREPSKDARRAFEDGGERPEREAFVVLRDSDQRTTYEAIVSLDEETVTSWKELSNTQPAMMGEEFVGVQDAVTANPEFRAAVEKRGADPDLAIVTAWSAGYDFVPEDIDRHTRLAHGIAWVKGSPEDRGAEAYNRPLSGIHAWVDLDEMAVLKVVDTGPKNPDVVRNLRDYKYRADDRDLRDDLKPYDVDQPEGPSWQIDGRRVDWQKWQFRVGFTEREGLVLYDVSYEDDGDRRPILNRVSAPEVITAYNDPDPDHNWKAPFDCGEYAVGRLANSLTEGCDCLGRMHYWDATVHDWEGNPATIENAICLHEEDHGILWKHYDWREGDHEVRRNRRLVVSFITTVGNYDFAFYYYFYQDGKIEGEVRLTGCNATGLLPPGESESGYAEMIGPDHKSMLHQHVFNFRLDMEVDGPTNSVYEAELKRLPYGPDGYAPTPHADVSRRATNPHGNGAYIERTKLETESAAMRDADPLAGRYWEIVNESVENEATGRPVGYRLRQKTGSPVAFANHPDSANGTRAGFARHHFWATQYDENELFPAGDYPNQHPGGEGLPKWVERDRSLDGEDVVVWYNLINLHVGAPEDWPILPVHMLSWQLEPVNFFEENPAIDVPPEHHIKELDRCESD
ncbi:primary-amine oxidase [Haloferacaceae archaeon DSL9]